MNNLCELSTLRIADMKIVLRLFVVLFLFPIQVQVSFSQEAKIKNTFKIVGERKVLHLPKIIGDKNCRIQSR